MFLHALWATLFYGEEAYIPTVSAMQTSQHLHSRR